MAGQLLKSVTIKRGKDAPIEMRTGSAAFGNGKCYFVSEDNSDLRMYDVENNDWSVLRNTPYRGSSLVVIDGLLTAVGGQRGTVSSADHEFTDKLYTLSNRRWVEKFPAMKSDAALGVTMKKHDPAVVQSGDLLLVIGGRDEKCQHHSRVDVLNTKTLEWSEAPEMSMSSPNPSAAICGDELYVMNPGYKSVVRCFLDELLGQSQPAGSVWSKVANPPNEDATLGSLCGQPVAIGGRFSDTPAINAYNPDKDSWYEIGKLAMARSKPLVAQLSEDKLVVVGGERSDRKPVILNEIVTGVL